MLNDKNNNLDNQLLFILKTRRLVWIDIQTRHKGEKNAYRRKMTIEYYGAKAPVLRTLTPLSAKYNSRSAEAAPIFKTLHNLIG